MRLTPNLVWSSNNSHFELMLIKSKLNQDLNVSWLAPCWRGGLLNVKSLSPSTDGVTLALIDADLWHFLSYISFLALASLCLCFYSTSLFAFSSFFCSLLHSALIRHIILAGSFASFFLSFRIFCCSATVFPPLSLTKQPLLVLPWPLWSWCIYHWSWEWSHCYQSMAHCDGDVFEQGEWLREAQTNLVAQVEACCWCQQLFCSCGYLSHLDLKVHRSIHLSTASSGCGLRASLLCKDQSLLYLAHLLHLHLIGSQIQTLRAMHLHSWVPQFQSIIKD